MILAIHSQCPNDFMSFLTSLSFVDCSDAKKMVKITDDIFISGRQGRPRIVIRGRLMASALNVKASFALE